MCFCFCVGGGGGGWRECANARERVCVLVCLGDSFRYDNYIHGMQLFVGVCARARARVCVLAYIWIVSVMTTTYRG